MVIVEPCLLKTSLVLQLLLRENGIIDLSPGFALMSEPPRWARRQALVVIKQPGITWQLAGPSAIGNPSPILYTSFVRLCTHSRNCAYWEIKKFGIIIFHIGLILRTHGLYDISGGADPTSGSLEDVLGVFSSLNAL